MTGDKVKAVVAALAELVQTKNTEIQHAVGLRKVTPLWAEKCHDYFVHSMNPTRRRPLLLMKHVLYMADRAPQLVDEGKLDKAMRWVGFMQGVLWAIGASTLGDLKRMNMPDPENPPLTMKEAVRLATSALARIVGQDPQQMRIEEVSKAEPDAAPVAWHITLSCLENDEHRRYRLFVVFETGVVVGSLLAELAKTLSGG